ncbi:MAG: AMP-binding protein [Pseudobacteriovorax sp.]|nr:AMP-binding protein [Pseudobacteriovorax sp.]
MGEILWDALIQYKSRVALIEIDRKKLNHQVTYAELMNAASHLVNEFNAVGLEPGDRILIQMSNQTRWIVAAIAGFYCGAVVVPVDVKASEDETKHYINEAKPKIIICEKHSLKRVRKSFEKVFVFAPNIDCDEFTKDLILDFSETLLKGKRAFRDIDDQATLVFSSGTGGSIKGCKLSHKNYLFQYDSLVEEYPMVEGDVFFSVLPKHHAIDFMCGFIAPLLTGATVVHQLSLRPEFLKHTMKTFAVTHTTFVPLILESIRSSIIRKIDDLPNLKKSIFRQLSKFSGRLGTGKSSTGLKKAIFGEVHSELGKDLKYIFCGGAYCNPEMIQFYHQLGINTVIGYGLTEACTVVTLQRQNELSPASVGKPVKGVELEIVKPNSDGVGEVAVKAPTVFMGYQGKEDSNIRDGWLMTGDLGCLTPAGELILVGRSKNIIVTPGGKNIYPEEIESAANGIIDTELVALSSQSLQERNSLNNDRVIAVVRNFDRDVLKQIKKLNSKLSPHKRISAVINWDKDFPLTSSLKVKRGDLVSQLRSSKFVLQEV